MIGSNSSIRLLGQIGSFSSVSVSHCMGSMPLALAVASNDWMAAARLPAASEPANNQFFFLCKGWHKKNWNFCWTELGAKHVGILQSLLTTCRLHYVDPYDYLVDVLQHIDQHPVVNVDQLTPRLWKDHFRAKPLRSDLHQLGLGRHAAQLALTSG